MVVHPYNDILLSNSKGWTANTCNEPQSMMLSGKEETKGCLLYDSMCMVFWGRLTHREKNRVSEWRDWGMREGIPYKGTQGSALDWWKCLLFQQYLTNLDGGYMTMCHHNSLNCTLTKDGCYCMQIIYLHRLYYMQI